MIGNYFKIGFRMLLRHKSYTLLNIIGLAIGIAVLPLFSYIFKVRYAMIGNGMNMKRYIVLQANIMLMVKLKI